MKFFKTIMVVTFLVVLSINVHAFASNDTKEERERSIVIENETDIIEDTEKYTQEKLMQEEIVEDENIVKTVEHPSEFLKIMIDNEFDEAKEEQAVQYGDIFYVSTSEFFKSLNFEIEWRNDQKQLILTKKDVRIQFSNNSQKMLILRGLYIEEKILNYRPIIQDDRIFIPVDALKYLPGYEVKENYTENKIYIESVEETSYSQKELDFTYIEALVNQGRYQVYQGNNLIFEYDNLLEAKKLADLYSKSTVVFCGIIWNNYKDYSANSLSNSECETDVITDGYEVYQNYKQINTYENYEEARSYASNFSNCLIYGKLRIYSTYPRYYYSENNKTYYCNTTEEYFEIYLKNELFSPLYKTATGETIWKYVPDGTYRIANVGLIRQYPELPRGCEVTSLAMLLQYKGIDVSKMTLAKEIKKISYIEDPNKGFIGDMYNIGNFGFGVYHKPIADLAEKYAKNKVLDITGCEFSVFNYYIKKGSPVWVINNTSFNSLDKKYFVCWQTSSGELYITMKEHSVLITGIDDKFVYINDPLTGKKRILDKQKFVNGWEQMGRQAIVLL